MSLTRGCEIARAGPELAIALKSGNFGEADFIERADRVLAGEAG